MIPNGSHNLNQSEISAKVFTIITHKLRHLKEGNKFCSVLLHRICGLCIFTYSTEFSLFAEATEPRKAGQAAQQSILHSSIFFSCFEDGAS